LRIEGCRRSLAHDDADDAMVELTELQDSVNREYDALRTYMRGLAGIPATPMKTVASGNTEFLLDAHVRGSIDLVDHVLQISREGISNIRRHAAAASARIDIRTQDSQLRISIEDDGVGFANDVVPWSIVSRVKELGGKVHVSEDRRAGAQVSI